MKRAEVQTAVEAEFIVGIRKLFTVLATGCRDPDNNQKTLSENMRAGIVVHKMALAIATDVVTEMFTE